MEGMGIPYLAAAVFILLTQQQNVLFVVGAADNSSFVTVQGLHFILNGSMFFANGFNAYWLMSMASDQSQRNNVSAALGEASGRGLNVARTWAFSDGGNGALQLSPGTYNENVFQGLDFVITEARKYDMKLILSFVNNYDDFGGKKQYVEWARSQSSQNLTSDDDFFSDSVVKEYYRNHVKTLLTRINTVTGVAYKDDPTILAWELMNEPRLPSDFSGKILQRWITEMAAYVKSIDSNHLLEAGLEGFYGQSSAENTSNPGFQVGTDFISNNQIPDIDFATVHSYPDQWLPSADDESQLSFLIDWMDIHTEDAEKILQKPVLFAEFGKSSRDMGYSTSQRDTMFSVIYDKVLSSAKSGGAAGGALFWQLLTPGMDAYRDGYEVILEESPSTANMIARQSQELQRLARNEEKS